MTEQQWLQCRDPDEMLRLVARRLTARQARLFAVACLRRVSAFMTPGSVAALDIAERFADGLANSGDLDRAGNTLLDEYVQKPREFNFQIWDASRDAVSDDTRRVLHDTWLHAAAGLPTELVVEEQAAQCGLLHDIAGNPYRPVVVDASWRTPDVVALATEIYENRAFDRLPVFADALSKAGCDEEAIRAHCLSDGSHARGCWVIDLLLGKA